MEDRSVEARRLAGEARDAEQRGDHESARDGFERAAALLGEPPDPLLADLLRWSGNASLQLGRTDRAEERYRRSLAVAEACGHVGGRAHALNCMAVAAQRRGDAEAAERTYHSAALLAVQAGDRLLQGMVEHNLGILANVRGEWDAALAHYRVSLRAFEAQASAQHASYVLNDLGMLYTDLRWFDQARTCFLLARERARARGDALVEGVVELNLAEMLVGLGELEEAGEACDRALSLAEERGDALRRAEALRVRGSLLGRMDAPAAMRVLQEAHALATGARDALLCAEVEREMGEVSRRGGDAGRARAAWERALDRFRALGAARDAGELERRLAALAA